MKQCNLLLAGTLIVLIVKIHDGNAFSSPSLSSSSSSARRNVDSSVIRSTPSPSSSTTTILFSSDVRYHHHHDHHNAINEEEILQMKQDIAKLRAEAEQRLQALTESLQQETTANPTTDAASSSDSTTARLTDPATGATMRRTTTSTTSEPSSTTMPSSTKRFPEGVNENTESFLEAQMEKEHRQQQQQDGPSSSSTTKKKFPDSEYEDTESLLTKRMESDRAFLENSSSSASTASMTTTETDSKPAATSISNTASKETVAHDAVGSSLMENTRWRIMLNIGREPGTWMPKTWGASGERLLMTVELEFATPETNHGIIADGDEFLGRDDIFGKEFVLDKGKSSPVQPLRVIDGTATLAPTMKEGGRRGLRVRNVGAWRVAPGEGPMGTSVLRFYLELEEEIRHSGSDVYCPAGRIYCTCGFFPHIDNRQKLGMNRKETIRKEQVSLNAQYSKLLEDDQKDESLISIDKMKRAKKMMDLRSEANKLTQAMTVAQVQEPDKSLLRLSQDQRVGLTREGGICCKVQKGLAMEYHILGKFEIASMTNREHSDYRELLP